CGRSPTSSTVIRTSATGGPQLGAQPLRGLVIDRQRQLPEVPGEHDAVVAPGTLDRDVLVEHVVEDALGGTGERIAPATAAAVVIFVALAGVMLDVARLLSDLVRVRSAGAHDERVRGSRMAACDPRHRIPLADH